MNCPECRGGILNFHDGSFGSGVFHPDGTEEMLWRNSLSVISAGASSMSDLELDERRSEDLIMPQQR